MTIEESGQYQARGFFTADGKFRNDVQQSNGSVKSGLFGTELKPSSGPLSYSVSRRWDGNMAVTYTPPGQSKRVTAVFAPSGPGTKSSDYVESAVPRAMKIPTAKSAPAESPIKADPEMSYDSGTKVKLPG